MPDDMVVFRAQLSEHVGRDIVYVNAKDSARHFDPIPFLHQYGGVLFLAFLAGAAKGVGSKVATVLWDKIASMASASFPQEGDEAERAQLVLMTEADQALSKLGSDLSNSYVKDFLAAGRQTVEDRLRKDNFPSAKAKKIAKEFTKSVEARMRHGKTG